MVRGSLPALLLAVFVCAPTSRAAAQAPDPEAVNAAIERGIAHLLASQNRDGSWGLDLNEHGAAHHDLRNGPTALALYTLLKCGFPSDHPSLQRALAFLLEDEPRHTYSTGVLLHALGALHDPAHEKRMRALLATLLELRQSGGWDYPGLNRADLSNTQVAALGLRAAAAAGLELPKGVWTDLVQATLRYQQKPVDVPGAEERAKTERRMAGFAYEPGGQPSASMTTAGLTILGIVTEEPGRIDHRFEADVEEARTLALNWLDQNYSVEGNPGGEPAWHLYYLYGLERVGALNGLARIGAHDWYADGATVILRVQRGDGGWRNDGRTVWPPTPLATADTCFALLFLRKATLSGPRPKALAARNDRTLEPWMLEYARSEAENVLRGQELVVTVSSEESQFHPKGDLLDGLQGSSWWAKEDDAEPWVKLTSERGVRVKELLMSPAAARETGRPECIAFERVELRLNGDKKPLVVEIERTFPLKTRVVLPRPTLVRELELRIVGAPKEAGKCVGFAELEAR